MVTKRHLRNGDRSSMLNSYMDADSFHMTNFDSNNSSQPATSAPRAHAHSGSKVSNVSENIDVMLDVLFIFLSAIAVIISMVIIIYSTTVIFNKYFLFCCRACRDCLDSNYSDESQENEEHEDDLENSTRPSAEAFGPVAFKARLWGLTLSERRAVLEKVFAHNTTIYQGEEPLSRSEKEHRTGNLEKDTGASSTCSTSPSSKEQVWDTESRTEESTSSEVIEGIDGDIDNDNGQERMNTDTVKHDYDQEAIPAEEKGGSRSLESYVLDERAMCAICLGGYDYGDNVLHGNYCNHKFHFECCMEWMKNCHDHCPYCRVEMMTPRDLRQAATHILSKERLEELSWGKRKHIVDMTDSPLSNVSDSVGFDYALPLSWEQGGIRNNRRPHQMEPASPAESDQAQLGQTILTPLGEDHSPVSCPNSTQAPAAESGGIRSENHLEPIREFLDQRLATPEEVLSSISQQASREADECTQ